MMYKLLPKREGQDQIFARIDDDGLCRVTCTAQNPEFQKAVLEQQPSNAVVEDGDSFNLNANPNDSILEDADGNVMTIDEAKEYVRGLP